MAAPQRLEPTTWRFPDPREAGDDGLVAVGADLEPSTLTHAYRHGMFPWPHDGMPLPWFSPDPRAVLPLDRWRVSRSLRRQMRRCGWHTTVDAAFEAVVRGCADRGPGEGTWITSAMRAAYTRLHRLGWAHSVEVWDGERLVGGLYGVMCGGVFTGESMFHRATDASKVALFELVERLREAGGALLDVQLRTDHLASLGAVEVPRSLFLELLEELRDDDVRLCTGRLPVARLADIAPS
jgi:leucyl/phenylalanyl-tRNA--protein transferase